MSRKDRRLRAYQARAAEIGGYAHFAQRLRERCEFDVGDPHDFAARVHRAVLDGDETVAQRLMRAHEADGGVFYRLFHEGEPIGYVLIGEDWNHWPITFFNQKQYRAKRYADKARRKGQKVSVQPREKVFTPPPQWRT